MSMCSAVSPSHCSFFFFNDTATTEIYTLSLHDALPIYAVLAAGELRLDGEEVDHLRERERDVREVDATAPDGQGPGDRKSTRLNSSHSQISYAVFCLKKKRNPEHRGVLRVELCRHMLAH